MLHNSLEKAQPLPPLPIPPDNATDALQHKARRVLVAHMWDLDDESFQFLHDCLDLTELSVRQRLKMRGIFRRYHTSLIHGSRCKDGGL
jgi:hypothetical protein